MLGGSLLSLNSSSGLHSTSGLLYSDIHITENRDTKRVVFMFTRLAHKNGQAITGTGAELGKMPSVGYTQLYHRNRDKDIKRDIKWVLSATEAENTSGSTMLQATGIHSRLLRKESGQERCSVLTQTIWCTV